jgi:archaellum component FlaC
MSKLGLAWDLECTPEVRIKARVQETSRQMLNEIQSEWQTVNQMYENFREKLLTTMTNLDENSSKLKNNLSQKLDELRSQVDVLIKDIKNFMELPEKSSQKLLKTAHHNFKILQRNFESICKIALA